MGILHVVTSFAAVFELIFFASATCQLEEDVFLELFCFVLALHLAFDFKLRLRFLLNLRHVNLNLELVADVVDVDRLLLSYGLLVLEML